MIEIYHNSRCRKSREALSMLEGEDYCITEYLKTPPTPEVLSSLIKKLNISAIDLIRKKESLFQDQYKDKNLAENEWIEVMCQNPVLIERPILIKGEKAIIGREAEKVKSFLKNGI